MLDRTFPRDGLRFAGIQILDAAGQISLIPCSLGSFVDSGVVSATLENGVIGRPSISEALGLLQSSLSVGLVPITSCRSFQIEQPNFTGNPDKAVSFPALTRRKVQYLIFCAPPLVRTFMFTPSKNRRPYNHQFDLFLMSAIPGVYQGSSFPSLLLELLFFDVSASSPGPHCMTLGSAIGKYPQVHRWYFVHGGSVC